MARCCRNGSRRKNRDAGRSTDSITVASINASPAVRNEMRSVFRTRVAQGNWRVRTREQDSARRRPRAGRGQGPFWTALDDNAQQPADFIVTSKNAQRFNYGSMACSRDFNSHDAQRLTISIPASVRQAGVPSGDVTGSEWLGTNSGRSDSREGVRDVRLNPPCDKLGHFIKNQSSIWALFLADGLGFRSIVRNDRCAVPSVTLQKTSSREMNLSISLDGLRKTSICCSRCHLPAPGSKGGIRFNGSMRLKRPLC